MTEEGREGPVVYKMPTNLHDLLVRPNDSMTIDYLSYLAAACTMLGEIKINQFSRKQLDFN